MNKSSSPPRYSPCARTAASSGAMLAGARPGLRNTAPYGAPCSSSGPSGPARQRMCGHCDCKSCSPGGLSRLSATVTLAPASAHHRAMARPDAPRPKISTYWSCRRSTAYLSFKVDRPTRHNSMVMIQKRTTTWVSFQPLFSKWWCKGAILNRRRPSPYLRRVYLK